MTDTATALKEILASVGSSKDDAEIWAALVTAYCRGLQDALNLGEREWVEDAIRPVAARTVDFDGLTSVTGGEFGGAF